MVLDALAGPEIRNTSPAPTPSAAASLNGLDVRDLTAQELCDAIDDLGIDDRWVVAEQVHRAVARGRGDQRIDLGEHRLDARNHSFQNLVIARIAEQLFLDDCLKPLEKAGFVINDYREVYENRDFGIEKGGVELPINVKVVGTLFANARDLGLEPEDCIPVSAAKAVAAADPDPEIGKEPDLLFVHLVEHGLRPKVDAYMDSLKGNEAVAWQLLTWYGSRGLKHAQDQFIEKLFARRGEKLLGLSEGSKNFRAISARRVLSVMAKNLTRVPQFGGGAYGGNPIIHISRREETLPWAAVATILRRNGIRQVIRGIRRTESQVASNPTL